MNALQAHIEAMNAKERAFVAEDPKNRCAFVLESDPKFWAEQGITTVAEFEEDMRRAEEHEKYKEMLNQGDDDQDDDQDDEIHGQCEDFPCCGHERGCCPSRSRKTGRQTNMICTCGARLPINSRFSICDSCLRSGDDEDGRGDDHECDY